MTCDDCERTLDEGVIRYKSRKSSNFDICENCIERVMQSRNENQSDYFRLENTD